MTNTHKSHQTSKKTKDTSTQVHTNGASLESDFQRRQRRAEARVLFDDQSLALLEHFAHQNLIELDQVAALAETPSGWSKIGLLMQAYFVEVIGNHMRLTEDGHRAMANLDDYAQRVISDLNETT